MSLNPKQVEELVKIVRQHAIYFGGGISSEDAKVRDRCDALISALERSAAGSGGRPAGRPRAAGPGSRTRAPRPAAPPQRKAVGRRGATVIPKPPPVPRGRAAGRAAGSRAPAPRPRAAARAQTGAEILAQAARPPARAEAKGGRPGAGKPAAGRTVRPGKKPPRPAARGAARAEPRPAPLSAAPAARPRRIEAVHLFDAYTAGTLPRYGGYIISSTFDSSSSYTVFDLVGYDNVQDIFLQSDALVFKSAGCRLYALVEPAGYAYKNVEPNQREENRKIPYRFRELHSLKTKKLDTVYVGKQPFTSYSSFTVVKPSAGNFSILFYNVPTVFQNMQDFLIPVLNQRLGIPKADALRAAKLILDGVLTFRVWLDL